MKSNKQLPADEAELQAAGFKMCSVRLAHLVRRNEVLYNSDVDGYTDKNLKDITWESIHRQLYAQYDAASDHIKELIRNSVRRRWKTLRNAIAREVRKNAITENYCRKKESTIISELEFLIPHIKSAYCAKLADELGLRESYQFVNDTNEPEQDHDDDDEDDVDLIDLTREFDVKPIIFKAEQPDGDDVIAARTGGGVGCDDDTNGSSSESVVVSRDALYPTVQLATGTLATNLTTANDASAKKSRSSTESAGTALPLNWSKEFCALAHYRGGEFTTVIDAIQDGDDGARVTEEQQQQQYQQTPTAIQPPAPPVAKKRRTAPPADESATDSISSTATTTAATSTTATTATMDWHARIAQLLCNERERNDAAAAAVAAAAAATAPATQSTRFDLDQDEDRMFMLSLVSDLKRIPAAKKPFVKAEIATVIARGLQ